MNEYKFKDILSKSIMNIYHIGTENELCNLFFLIIYRSQFFVQNINKLILYNVE